jgi:hypothetical protein
MLSHRIVFPAVVLFLIAATFSQALIAQQAIFSARQSSLLGLENVRAFGNTGNSGPDLGLCGVLACEGLLDSGGAHYRRWRVHIHRRDGRAFSRDQQIELRFHESNTGYPSPEVSHVMELVQGSLEHSSTFLEPAHPTNSMSYWWVELKFFVAGRELTGLSDQLSFSTQDDPTENRVQALIVAEKKQLFKFLDSNLSDGDRARLSRPDVSLLTKHMIAEPEGLPSDRRELTNLDYILIDPPAFDSLSDQQKIALKEFVLGGGEAIFLAGLKKLKGSDCEKWIESLCSKPPGEFPLLSNDPLYKSRRRCTDIGFGSISVSDMSIIDAYKLNKRETQIDKVSERSARLFDVDKMHWIIERIGRPPVLAFLFSITAFSLVGGPGLIWWVNRKMQRPAWLLLVFPMLAIGLTGGIFLYAFLRDGFSLYGRLRSMTVINNRNGEGFAYSRQTYFSGFPPQESRFDPRSEVWQVLSNHEESRNGYAAWNLPPSSTLRWSDKAQSYEGLLNARDQKQWIVGTPIKYQPFSVSESDEVPIMKNLLGETIVFAVLADDDKKLWKIANLAGGQSQSAEAITNADALKQTQKLVPANVYPLGYIDSPNLSLLDWWSGMSYSTTWRRNRSSQAGLEDGFENLRGLDQPRMFVLFLERGSHIDRPFGNKAIEGDGSHIVMGKW